MRIVALADTHTFERDLPAVPAGDVFVHAGDLCRAGTLEEQRPVARWIQNLPHPHKIVVAGNHDWCFVREPNEAIAILGPTIHYLQDREVAIEGVRFWGSPWQPEYNNWAFNLPRGPALAEKWALIPKGIDVLITHGPPFSIGDYSGDDPIRHGCRDLLAAMPRIRPLLHLCGHIHQTGGFQNRDGIAFANVTTWECERGPTVIDLDIASRTVTPVEVPPAENRPSTGVFVNGQPI